MPRKSKQAPEKESSDFAADLAAEMDANLGPESEQPEVQPSESPQPEAEETQAEPTGEQQAEPEVAEQEQQQQSAEEEMPLYRRLGFTDDFKDQTPEQLAEQAATQAVQFRQYATQLQHQFEQAQQQLRYLQSQQQQPQQQPQPAPEPEQPQTEYPFKPVQFDPKWSKYAQAFRTYQDPDTGLLRADTPMEVREAWQGYQDYQSNLEQNLAKLGDQESLDKYVQSRIDEAIQSRVPELLQNTNHQTQQMSALEQRMQHLAPVLYYTDMFGNPQLTQLGQEVAQEVQGFQRMGASDPVQMLDAAVQRVSERYPQQQQPAQQVQQQAPAQQQQTVQQQNEARKRELLRKGNQGGTLYGSQDPNGPQQNPLLSLEDSLRKDLDAAGITDDQFAGTI